VPSAHVDAAPVLNVVTAAVIIVIGDGHARPDSDARRDDDGAATRSYRNSGTRPDDDVGLIIDDAARRDGDDTARLEQGEGDDGEEEEWFHRWW
jgi:hypothetical protein